MTVLEQLRALYFGATKATVGDDFVRAIDLFKQLTVEEEREKAAVFMEGIAEMRREWAAESGGPRKSGGKSRPAGSASARAAGLAGLQDVHLLACRETHALRHVAVDGQPLDVAFREPQQQRQRHGRRRARVLHQSRDHAVGLGPRAAGPDDAQDLLRHVLHPGEVLDLGLGELRARQHRRRDDAIGIAHEDRSLLAPTERRDLDLVRHRQGGQQDMRGLFVLGQRLERDGRQFHGIHGLGPQRRVAGLVPGPQLFRRLRLREELRQGLRRDGVDGREGQCGDVRIRVGGHQRQQGQAIAALRRRQSTRGEQARIARHACADEDIDDR
jgi:hypothetical protein